MRGQKNFRNLHFKNDNNNNGKILKVSKPLKETISTMFTYFRKITVKQNNLKKEKLVDIMFEELKFPN